MPSEQRLHPISLLFAFSSSLKAFALPGLGVLIAGRSAARSPDSAMESWQLWIMLLLIPAAVHAVANYLSYRLRYESSELVIRSGIFFKNERHVPYARIQNLEAVRNLFHRLFGVVEVRVENASGKEPEATISVLPLAAFEEMRRRVFAGRETAVGGEAALEPMAGTRSRLEDEGQTLHQLAVRELLLCGFIENRGMVPIAAAYGFLWEFGPLSRMLGRLMDEDSLQGGALRDIARTMDAGRWPSSEQVAVVAAGVLGLLVFVRLVSMVWATVRLYRFRLSRAGSDLRTEYGLFTRVASTTPLGRIQTVTIREGPLHRWLGRAAVRVETAGAGRAGKPDGSHEREWLAPIIHASALPALMSHLLPEFATGTVDFRGVHPRAFRRAVKPAAALGACLAAATVPGLGWRFAAMLLPVTLAWFVASAWKRVQHMQWSASDDLVIFKSGWIWRTTTIARVAKVQAVTHYESPFDRRTAMGRVRIDTAGAGVHRIDIPYLPDDVARALHLRLASGAATTAFRW